MLSLTCVVSTQTYASDPLQKEISSEGLVKGTVVDENGEPIISVSIQEIGTTRGTVSDTNGNFL